MEARVHDDVDAFEHLAGPRYASNPVANTTVITNLRRARHTEQTDLVLVTFHDGDEVVGSLFRQPPWPAQLSDLPITLVDQAVKVLRDIDPDLPGVNGPHDVAETFATRWAANHQVVMSHRLYRLAELNPPAIPGTPRLATEDDIPLLARWRDDFTAEALPPELQLGPPADEMMRRSLAMGSGLMLWEVDNTPVAWATAGKPANGMTRIGPVYTPPEHRRHGYGAAVTAAVADWAASQGAADIVLFADLLNPVSNSIYQRIGFRPVDDWTELTWKR